MILSTTPLISESDIYTRHFHLFLKLYTIIVDDFYYEMSQYDIDYLLVYSKSVLITSLEVPTRGQSYSSFSENQSFVRFMPNNTKVVILMQSMCGVASICCCPPRAY